MKSWKYIALMLTALSLSCGSNQKTEDVSDSALMAPVDTLGSDTSRQNSVADSTNKPRKDTAR